MMKAQIARMMRMLRPNTKGVNDGIASESSDDEPDNDETLHLLENIDVKGRIQQNKMQFYLPL